MNIMDIEFNLELTLYYGISVPARVSTLGSFSKGHALISDGTLIKKTIVKSVIMTNMTKVPTRWQEKC